MFSLPDSLFKLIHGGERNTEGSEKSARGREFPWKLGVIFAATNMTH